MKKLMAIVLVNLLGFLGCSDSNDATSTFDGQVVTVAPFGIVETPSPTYEWTPVPWATKYHLLVQGSTQATTTQDSNETAIIDEWYTAEEAGCESEDGLCTVTPDIEVFGENTWMVEACATDENCALSEPMKFSIRSGFRGTRFYMSEDDEWVVYDSYKQLFWTRVARTNVIDIYPGVTWDDAISRCQDLNAYTGIRWRLPTLSELVSLNEETIPPEPYHLPENHPFKLVADKPVGFDLNRGAYWTSTEAEAGPEGPKAMAIILHKSFCRIFSEYKSVPLYAWCVRDCCVEPFCPPTANPCQ
jgi:hypothetical protein